MKRSWIAAIATLIAVSASALGAATAGSSSTAGTADEYMAPPAVSCADPIVVSSTGPSDEESMSQPRLGLGQDLQTTLTLNVSLPAGTYTVQAATHDAYSFRDEVGVQAHEQARIVLTAAGTELAATGYTTELGDNAYTGWALDELGEITIDQNADAIRIEHFGAANAIEGPNSLKVTAICIEPVGDDAVDVCADLVEGEAVPTECLPADPCAGLVEGAETSAECEPVDVCAGLVEGEAVPVECEPVDVCADLVEGEAVPVECEPVDVCAGLVEGEAVPAECEAPKEPCVVEGDGVPAHDCGEVEAPPVTQAPVTEPPATEPPVTEVAVTEPPATDPPVTDPPATEAPVTEAPVTEAPATEAPVTEAAATDPPATDAPLAPEAPTTAAPASVVAVSAAPASTEATDTGSASTTRMSTVQAELNEPALQVAQQTPGAQLPVTGSSTGLIAALGVILAIVGSACLGIASKKLELF